MSLSSVLLSKKYIVVALYYVTRYCETKALLWGTVEEFAKLVVNSLHSHGAPTMVITDIGTVFTTKLRKPLNWVAPAPAKQITIHRQYAH